MLERVTNETKRKTNDTVSNEVVTTINIMIMVIKIVIIGIVGIDIIKDIHTETITKVAVGIFVNGINTITTIVTDTEMENIVNKMGI